MVVQERGVLKEAVADNTGTAESGSKLISFIKSSLGETVTVVEDLELPGEVSCMVNPEVHAQSCYKNFIIVFFLTLVTKIHFLLTC